jgi:hypothetical protein
MPNFMVTVRRSAYTYQTIKVLAEDKSSAKTEAEFALEDDDAWPEKPDDVEIGSVSVEEVDDAEAG